MLQPSSNPLYASLLSFPPPPRLWIPAQMPTVSPSLCHAKLSFGNWLKSTRITPTPTTVTPSTFLRRAQQPLVSHNERAAELLRWDLRLAMGTRSGHSWAQERPLWSYTTEVNMHSLCLCFLIKRLIIYTPFPDTQQTWALFYVILRTFCCHGV